MSIIDNCGHSPQMEKPDEFNAVVSSFLDRL
jgi:pimeloyl-ACP methyl ester carboxylesterase